MGEPLVAGGALSVKVKTSLFEESRKGILARDGVGDFRIISKRGVRLDFGREILSQKTETS